MLLFMLLLKMDSTYPMFLLSRRSMVRFVKIRISSIIIWIDECIGATVVALYLFSGLSISV